MINLSSLRLFCLANRSFNVKILDLLYDSIR